MNTKQGSIALPARKLWLSSKNIWPLLLPLIALVHLSSLVGDYVFDDAAVIDDERLLDFWSFSWFSVKGRPVVLGLFALEFTYFGKSPAVTHLINVVLHLIAATGLFLVSRTLIAAKQRECSWNRTTAVAAGIAGVWSVHPLVTCVVTYSVQRYELMASMWMIWSVWAWVQCFFPISQADNGEVKYEKQRGLRLPYHWLILSIICAWMAYGSKQMSAGLPIIIFLLHRSLVRETAAHALDKSASQSTRSRKMKVGAALGMMAIAVPVLMGMWMIVPGLLRADNRTSTIGYGLSGINGWDYIAFQPIVWAKYLQLTFRPVGQVLDYGWLPPSFNAMRFLGGGLWIAILLGIAVTCRRGQWLASLVVCVLAILAPTSLVPLTDSIFEHRFYLPSAIVIGITFYGMAAWMQRMQWGQPVHQMLFFSAAFISLSGLLVSRNLDYATPLQLAKTDYERQPENPRAIWRLATLDPGITPPRYQRLLQEAIQMSDQRGYFYPGTNYKWPRELADSLYVTGQLESARRWYERTLPESHDELQRTEIQWSLALIASALGEKKNADAWFAKALNGSESLRDQIRETLEHHRQRYQ